MESCKACVSRAASGAFKGVDASRFAHKRLWAMAVEALIRRHYARRFSVLLLNTWLADYKAAEAQQLDWRGLDRIDFRRS